MKIDWRQGEGNGVFRTFSHSRRSGVALSRGVWHAPDQRQSGSALLLVLFAIVLLSGLITATVAFVSVDVDEYGALNKQFRARQLAESGLAFGLNPQVQSQDTALLDQQAPDGGRFRVIITSESTKLNINFILENNRDDLLGDLFSRWGVAPKVSEA